jgi:hypothetical protein
VVELRKNRLTDVSALLLECLWLCSHGASLNNR